MAQQKGSTVDILVGYETTFATAASAGFVLPINSIDIQPSQNLTTPQTLTGTRQPVAPIRGNKDVSGTVVVPVDSDAMWYWLKAVFNDPVQTGSDPYVHEYKIGDTIPSLTIETGHTDLDTDSFIRMVGCKVTTFAVTIGGDGEMVANIGFMGANYSVETSAFDGSPTTVTLGSRIQQLNTALTEGGGAYSDATEVTFNLDNGLDGDTYVIGGSGARGAINEGIASVTGTLTFLFTEDSLLDKAVAGTESALKMTGTRSASAIFELEVQELEYAVAAPPVQGPQGVKATLNFQGFYGNEDETSALVARLTNAVDHS